MPQQAYACRITPDNFGVISSENPKFNLDEIKKFLEDQGDGYFIRDETSPWDCKYMPMLVFQQIYLFQRYDADELFHPIVMDDPKKEKK